MQKVKRKSIRQVLRDHQLRTSRWVYSDGHGTYMDRESALRRARVLNREGIDSKVEQADRPYITKSGKQVKYFVLEREAEGEKPVLLLLERGKPKEERSSTNKPQMTLLTVKHPSASGRQTGLRRGKSLRITPKTPRLRR